MTFKLIKMNNSFIDFRLKVLCFHKKCLGNEMFGSNSNSRTSGRNFKIKK